MKSKARKKKPVKKIAAKQLTEYQAWLEMAKMWKKAIPIQPNIWLAPTPYGLKAGLYSTLCSMYADDLLEYFTYTHMKSVIITRVPVPISSLYAWPQTRSGAKQRVKFCMEQAKMCAKKDRAMP